MFCRRYELPSALEAVAIPTEQQLEEECRKRGEEDGKRKQLVAKELERKMKEQRKKEEAEEKKRMAAEEKRKRLEEEEEERRKLEESKRAVEEERKKLAARMEELEKKEKVIRDEEEKLTAEKQKKAEEELEKKKEKEDFERKVKALEEESMQLAKEQRKLEDEKKRQEEENKRKDLERREKEADIVKERQRLVSERLRLETKRLEEERKKFEEDKRETQLNLVKELKKRQEEHVPKKTDGILKEQSILFEGNKSRDGRSKREDCEAEKSKEEEVLEVARKDKVKLVTEGVEDNEPSKNGVVTVNVEKPKESSKTIEDEVLSKPDHTAPVPAPAPSLPDLSRPEPLLLPDLSREPLLPELSREPLLASVARAKLQKRRPSRRKESCLENVEDVGEDLAAEKTRGDVEEVDEGVKVSSRREVNELVVELSKKRKKQGTDELKSLEREADCLEGGVVEDLESRTGAKTSEKAPVKESDAVTQSSSMLTETPVKVKTSAVRRRQLSQCNGGFEAVEVTKKREHAEDVEHAVDVIGEVAEKEVSVKKKVVKKGKVKKIIHMSRSTVGKKVEMSEKLNVAKEESVKGKGASEPPKASGSCQEERVGALLLKVRKGLVEQVNQVEKVTEEAPDEVFEAAPDTSRRSRRTKKTVPLVVVEPASAKHEQKKKRKGVASIEEPPSPVKMNKKEQQTEKAFKRRGGAVLENGSPVKKVKEVVSGVQKAAEAKSDPHDSSLMVKLAARRRQSEGLTTARYDARVEAAKRVKTPVVENSFEKKIAARRKKVEPAVVLDEIDESMISTFPSPVKRLAPPPASGRGGRSPGRYSRGEDTEEYFSAAEETRNLTARPRRNANKKFSSFVGVDADTPEHKEEVVARPVGRRAGRGRDSEVKAALRDGRADVSVSICSVSHLYNELLTSKLMPSRLSARVCQVSEPQAPLATSTTAKLPTGASPKARGTARRGKKRTTGNPVSRNHVIWQTVLKYWSAVFYWHFGLINFGLFR